jgi:hypothetical protein
MVQAGGLEPPTSGSTDQRSNQLSYACMRVRLLVKPNPSGRNLGAARLFGKRGAPDWHACIDKARTLRSGLWLACSPNRAIYSSASGRLVEGAADAFLDRLDSFGRYLLRVLG